MAPERVLVWSEHVSLFLLRGFARASRCFLGLSPVSRATDGGQYEDLGVNPFGTRLGIRKGGEGAVRLPKIIVLASGLSPTHGPLTLRPDMPVLRGPLFLPKYVLVTIF